MDIELVNKIKRITIIALASDDQLMETLVLKGGNAIDLAYQPDNDIVSRTSYDLDYSIYDGDFTEDQASISSRIEATLRQTFLENDLVVFDYKFLNKPKQMNEKLIDFWGGYKVEFKVIDKEDHDKHIGNNDKIRRASIPLNPNHSPVFELEFSKFEHVEKKSKIEVDGYKIYVYTPEMIVFEKLRAVCQQLPDYGAIIPSFSPRARARDFYDIHLIWDLFKIDPTTEENKELIENIFEAKRVPLSFIKQIRNNKTLHQDNWDLVKDTISQLEKVEDFDFYFNFVLDLFEPITFH